MKLFATLTLACGLVSLSLAQNPSDSKEARKKRQPAVDTTARDQQRAERAARAREEKRARDEQRSRDNSVIVFADPTRRFYFEGRCRKGGDSLQMINLGEAKRLGYGRRKCD